MFEILGIEFVYVAELVFLVSTCLDTFNIVSAAYISTYCLQLKHFW